jgi:hypothetical protein
VDGRFRLTNLIIIRAFYVDRIRNKILEALEYITNSLVFEYFRYLVSNNINIHILTRNMHSSQSINLSFMYLL